MTDRDFPSFCLMKLYKVITSDEIFFLFGRNRCYSWTDDTLSLVSRNQLRIKKDFLSLMSLMISFSIMISTNFMLLLVFHTIEIIFKIKFVKYCFNFIYKMYMIYDDPARKRNKTKIQQASTIWMRLNKLTRRITLSTITHKNIHKVKAYQTINKVYFFIDLFLYKSSFLPGNYFTSI